MLEFCNTDPELVVVTRMVCVTGFCFNKLCGCFGWKRKFCVILGDKIQIISSTDFMINGVDQYFFFSSGYFTVVKKGKFLLCGEGFSHDARINFTKIVASGSFVSF